MGRIGVGIKHAGGGLDRAAGADRVIPAQALVGALNIGKLRKGRQLGAAHALFVQLTVGEEAPGKRDAAHA